MTIVTFNDIENLISNIARDYLKDDSYRLTYRYFAPSHECDKKFTLISELKRKFVLISLKGGWYNFSDSSACLQSTVTTEVVVTEFSDIDPKTIATQNLVNGSVVFSKIFYLIKHAFKRNPSIYTDDLQEIKAQNQIRIKRQSSCASTNYYEARNIDLDKLPDSFINSIMLRIHNISGFKKAKANSITCVTVYRKFNCNTGNTRLCARIRIKYNDKERYIDLK